MTSRFTTAIQVRQERGRNDSGFTLTELMVSMLLTSVLLAVIIAPLISVTDTATTTEMASEAAATTTAVIESMQAGVSSASEMCLPTQVTPSASSSPQVVQPGNAVRVLTDVFDTTGVTPEWEQWWIDPTSGQLRAQTWPATATATQPTTWRVVTGNVVHTTGGRLPFAITSEGISTSGALTAGNYTAADATADATAGDAGTWTYTLHVYTPATGTIAQTEPTSGTVSTAGSAAFSDQLTATGNSGTVTFTQSTGNAYLAITKSGQVTTATTLVAGQPVPITLAAGNYTATGTDTDGNGNTGTFTYTLHVYAYPIAAGTIVQTAPTSGTVTTTGSAGFSDQLAVTGNSTAATFTQTTGSANLAIAAPSGSTRPKLLTITITASTGVKATAVSTPITSSIAALDTAYFTAPGTCLAEVH